MICKSNIVVMYNLGIHEAKAIRGAIRDVGARPIFLLPYGADLNPTEQPSAKLEHLLRKAKEGSEEADYRRIGVIIPATSQVESRNCITNAGYGSVEIKNDFMLKLSSVQ